jgi:hypothetical protein
MCYAGGVNGSTTRQHAPSPRIDPLHGLGESHTPGESFPNDNVTSF